MQVKQKAEVRYELHSECIPRSLLRGIRANQKIDRIPYSRRVPAACCRDSSNIGCLVFLDKRTVLFVVLYL